MAQLQLYICRVMRTTGFLQMVMLALLICGDQPVSLLKCTNEILFRDQLIY
jgi:hypothetical protein